MDVDVCRRVDAGLCQFKQPTTRQERPGFHSANASRGRHRHRSRRTKYARRPEVCFLLNLKKFEKNDTFKIYSGAQFRVGPGPPQWFQVRRPRPVI